MPDFSRCGIIVGFALFFALSIDSDALGRWRRHSHHGSVSDLHMLSSHRELDEDARNIADAIQKARRSAAMSVVAPPLPPGPVLCLGCDVDASLIIPHENRSGHSLIDANGGSYLIDQGLGEFSGTIEFAGTNGLLNELMLGLSLHQEIVWTIDRPAPLDLFLEFSDVTYSGIPFHLSMERIDPTNSLIFELVVFPSNGASQTEFEFPTAGTYRFTIDWNEPGYILPAGDSTTGIGSYLIAWAVVPEPSSLTMLMIAPLLLFRRKHVRCNS